MQGSELEEQEDLTLTTEEEKRLQEAVQRPILEASDRRRGQIIECNIKARQRRCRFKDEMNRSILTLHSVEL